MGSMVERAQILVSGVVQGVGFRPFVYNLAESLRLAGYVTNTGDGVLIDVEGQLVGDFIDRLRREAPPLSRITGVAIERLPALGYSGFAIRPSTGPAERLPFTLVSPDVSVCEDCLSELLDPVDRRYQYPFINCTNCGPRYSITYSTPYDRPNTTMAQFTMCPACRSEYEDPRNRRFHAQPNACPKCGPTVEFRMRNAECTLHSRDARESAGVNGVRNGEALVESIKILKNGGVVALKGLGGFHIACDASNDHAVKRLREKKRKSNKPFAVMVPSIESAREFCHVSPEEEKILLSNRRPIVLLLKKTGTILSDAVSPGNKYIGCMLPYTPLHYLLFHPGTGRSGRAHFTALVMTSGNLSEEPIVRDNDEAVKKLSDIADAFLLHNRDIFMRVDDSVIRLRNADCGMQNEKREISTTQSGIVNPKSELFFIRRSRGFAPDPVELHGHGPEVLACGADLKNTFTITKGRFAIPSQHIGDMENYETLRFFEETLENLKSQYRADPKIVAHDLHPGYLSTQWALECGVRSAECGVKTYGVQHHYAHIGSVMAEHGLKGKVIGVAFDGTGYGTDGNLWGGEFLIAGTSGFERAGHFKYIPLPGGETAIREPWRTAVSLVMQACGDQAAELLSGIGFAGRIGPGAIGTVMRVAVSRDFSPLASGAGRLFDAVSALLGVCDCNTFEGEAAMALEALVTDGNEDEYPVEYIRENGYTVVNFGPCIRNIISDIRRSVSPETVSTLFHNTVAAVVRTMALELSTRRGLKDVALSGGTFQNLYLLNRTVRLLRTEGLNVYMNEKVPCNDGGISLGQAYLIRERLKKLVP